MATILLRGCQHCGGDVIPEAVVHNEFCGREWKCIQCSRVALYENGVPTGRRAVPSTAPRGPQFHHRHSEGR